MKHKVQQSQELYNTIEKLYAMVTGKKSTQSYLVQLQYIGNEIQTLLQQTNSSSFHAIPVCLWLVMWWYRMSFSNTSSRSTRWRQIRHINSMLGYGQSLIDHFHRVKISRISRISRIPRIPRIPNKTPLEKSSACTSSKSYMIEFPWNADK